MHEPLFFSLAALLLSGKQALISTVMSGTTTYGLKCFH